MPTRSRRLFRDAGFETVDIQINVGNLEFKRAIRKFETIADQADIAVVYYAGHGLEISGVNYLIPVDARLASDRDAEDEAIPLERLVSSADGAKRLRLIILDACRDNPFVRVMRRERKTATRAVTAGLGKVEPTSTDTLIAYAAKAGSTADDGDGLHSPFTTAVLKNLTVPGLDVRLAFGRVRDEVLKMTASRQEPFVYGSLGGGNIALVPAPAVPSEAAVNEVKADYELVQKIGSKRAWEVFLGTHPTGFYADLARAQIEALSNQGSVNLAALPQPPTPSRDTPTKRIAGVGPGEGFHRSGRSPKVHQALPGLAAVDQRAAADWYPAEGRRGARGTGAPRARGGTQGRRGGAAACGTTQGRTGRGEKARGGGAPRPGGGSRAKGQGCRSRTQGRRSQTEGRAGRKGSRGRGGSGAARGERATGQGRGGRTEGQGCGRRAQGERGKAQGRA